MWWAVAWVILACLNSMGAKWGFKKFDLAYALQASLLSIGSFIMAAAYVVSA